MELCGLNAAFLAVTALESPVLVNQTERLPTRAVTRLGRRSACRTCSDDPTMTESDPLFRGTELWDFWPPQISRSCTHLTLAFCLPILTDPGLVYLDLHSFPCIDTTAPLVLLRLSVPESNISSSDFQVNNGADNGATAEVGTSGLFWLLACWSATSGNVYVPNRHCRRHVGVLQLY
ncbi:uncharacterized protein B0T15DRAFT_274117 [Chaetomium strumarium]|uniref:Secreted protein n=1 Tax=Chaetomium strumarium TaxID=1170767 RepID=A0AAJ0GPC3_9PEZI|nr:hypothetical protein B0T15DRAFT_274117 [Chaetomium strumarium]